MFRRYPLVACALLLTFANRGAPPRQRPITLRRWRRRLPYGTTLFPPRFNTVGGQTEVGGSRRWRLFVTRRGIAATWSNLSRAEPRLPARNPTFPTSPGPRRPAGFRASTATETWPAIPDHQRHLLSPLVPARRRQFGHAPAHASQRRPGGPTR